MHTRSSIVKSESDSDAVAVWDGTRKPETIALAFEESTALRAMYTTWFDAADAKIVAVFSVGAAIVGLAPALHWGKRLSGLPRDLWIFALVAWLVAAFCCWSAYSPREFRIDPHPRILTGSDWLSLDTAEYRFYRLEDMGKTHDKNLDQVKRKAGLVRWAMIATAAEVVALAAAFLLNPV